MKRACRDGSPSLILSYSRSAVGQTGDGHFSPVGAYNERRDMALILDAATAWSAPVTPTEDEVW